MNELDSFEKLIKGSLQEHEAPFDAGAWDAMSGQLDRHARMQTIKKISWIGGSIVGAGLIVGGIALSQSPETPDQTALNINNDAPAIVNDQTNNTPENNIAYNDAITPENPEIIDVNVTPADPVNNNGNAEANINNNHNNATEPGNGQSESGENTNDPNANNSNTNDPDGIVAENGNIGDPVIIQNEITPVSADFNADATEGCEGMKVMFEVANPQAGVTYKWEVAKDIYALGTRTEMTYNHAGKHTMRLHAEGKDGSTDTQEMEINVNELPQAKFTYSVSEKTLEPTVQFHNNSIDGESWSWNFGDGYTAATNAPSHHFERIGDYQVTLEATHSNGCVTSTTQIVNVPHTVNALAPTAMNPESADPKVNSFMPGAVVNGDYPFTLTIYDARTNEIVFVSQDLNFRWDGRDKDGNIKYNYAYVWKLDLTNKHGQKESFAGHIVTVAP